MREYRPQQLDTETAQTSAATMDAGRATLGEATDGAVGVEYASMSVFPGANIADDGSEPPPPTGAQTRAAPTGTAAASAATTGPDTTPSPPPDAVEVTAGDNPDALERVYGDKQTDAHGGHFEHHHKHYGAEKHRPKKDEYNSKHIKSDKIGKDVAARPGVVVGKGKHADGVFNLKPHTTAIRYTFVKRDGHDIATPYDTIDADKLAHHNYKFKHPKAKGDAQGRKLRLLLNPAHPRTLYINGAPERCVLSWVDGLTAAWIKVSDLDGDHSKILHAADARAASWDPHAPYKDPSHIEKHTTPYVFRNDKVARKDKHDDPVRHGQVEGRVLDAGAHGGNNVSHYLSHDQRKPGFDAQGNQLGKNVTRSAIAVAMNLPNVGEPPIALDTAQAGEKFYVMNDHGTFWRQVPVFENGAHRSNRTQTWVFGYLAMVSGDKQVPDPSRRGWVPLRTLAEANHLVTHNIKPRDH